MNEQFRKFKKKVRREIALKCALSAATAAVLAVNAVLLPCLLCKVNLHWAWYLLIAFGAFVLGGGAAFLLLRADDKKIARRLDGELRLSERVQTALYYEGAEGDLPALQRKDTEAALAGLSVKKLPFRNLALTVLLAVVLALGVIAVPVIAVFAGADGQGSEVPYDPPREVTDWEWQALDELIEDVKTSERADSFTKTGIVGELEGLRSVLLAGVSQSNLPVFVQNTVGNVRNVVRDANNRDAGDEQKAKNTEEGEYVVKRLYEIFSLSGGGEDPTPAPEKPGEDPSSPGHNTGTGELDVSGVPFFDPDKGYVSSGDPAVREQYYAEIQKAMLEGTISRAEWEKIVAMYFSDLKEKEEE